MNLPTIIKTFKVNPFLIILSLALTILLATAVATKRALYADKFLTLSIAALLTIAFPPLLILTAPLALLLSIKSD